MYNNQSMDDQNDYLHLCTTMPVMWQIVSQPIKFNNQTGY